MKEKITLGGGCFWCLEAVYQLVGGITAVTSGYAGGNQPDPTYQEVCTGNTGHAEVVQLEFDTKKISVKEILEIFFSIHDPTTLNRQGADVGTQYRSAIYFHNPAQETAVRKMIESLETDQSYQNPIVTEVKALDIFYPAEEYHQNYFKRNPYQGYCQFVISPKVKKFKKHFLLQ